MFSVTKSYKDLPFAHRQPDHEGHCRFVHGHNWAFEITFECDKLDKCGFVIDLGSLKPLKVWLENMFDHTLVLNETDPMLASFGRVLEEFSDIRKVPNCGMEGLAQFVMINVNRMIHRGELESLEQVEDGHAASQRRVQCSKVVCIEDGKNSATFEPK